MHSLQALRLQLWQFLIPKSELFPTDWLGTGASLAERARTRDSALAESRGGESFLHLLVPPSGFGGIATYQPIRDRQSPFAVKLKLRWSIVK